MIKSEIKNIVCSAILKIYPEFSSVDFSLDEPPADINADLSSNVAFTLSRNIKNSPIEIANSLASHIATGKTIKKVEVSKNGFLNFTLQENYLQNIVSQIFSGKEGLSKTSPETLGSVLIEFVSANPTGPLHIGHGRGAALGDSLARIYRQMGYPVQTEYYVNDVGVQMQILADSVQAKYRELNGEKNVFPENGYKGSYIKDIAEKMCKEGRNDFDQYPKKYILDWISKDLEDFGAHIDSWFSESTLYQNKKVDEMLKFLESKKCVKEKDGALWFVSSGDDLEEEGEERVLRKSDGKCTYFTSDIAYHKNKYERGFKKCIDIWGHDHHGYVPRVESAVSVLGLPKNFLKILLYQLVSLKRGGKRVAMSTRAGEFVTLKEIMDEVGKDACRFFFAMRSPNSQLEFDLDLAKKQSNENPVYYVQYVHARICSIFREAEKRGIILSATDIPEWNKIEKEERELMKKAGFFTDVLDYTLQISSPHPIAEYLIDLATEFHRFYDKHRVLDAEDKIRKSRLILLRATQNVVRTALSLLGVSAPESM